jgi:hypothetical protein
MSLAERRSAIGLYEAIRKRTGTVLFSMIDVGSLMAAAIS